MMLPVRCTHQEQDEWPDGPDCSVSLSVRDKYWIKNGIMLVWTEAQRDNGRLRSDFFQILIFETRRGNKVSKLDQKYYSYLDVDGTGYTTNNNGVWLASHQQTKVSECCCRTAHVCVMCVWAFGSKQINEIPMLIELIIWMNECSWFTKDKHRK